MNTALTEVWKPVPGYEGLYEVSSFGRVRSFRWGREHILKPSRPRRYPQLVFSVDGRRKTYKVHYLVLTAFKGARPYRQVCRHLNDDPTDNRLENLCWGTVLENREDARKNQRYPKGEENPAAKLTEQDVRQIRHRWLGGEKQSILARDFGINPQTVWRICHRKIWAHVEQTGA